MSAPTTILLFLDIFSTVSCRSSQNVSFSSRVHLTCGAYPLMTFNITPSSYLQTYYPVCYPPQFHYPIHMLLFQYDSYTIIFFHFHSTTFYILHLCILLSPLFQQVFCTHSMSTPLRSVRSATFLPLPVMVPTFNVAILSLIFVAFFLSSFLSFLLLHCFPPLLCIQVACSPVTLGAQSLVTVVVFPGFDRFGMK